MKSLRLTIGDSTVQHWYRNTSDQQRSLVAIYLWDRRYAHARLCA